MWANIQIRSIYPFFFVLSHSVVSNSVTFWTVGHQAPLFMWFFRQEYWNGSPFSSSRESSRPRDRTWVSCISCIGRQILYLLSYQGKPYPYIQFSSVVSDSLWPHGLQHAKCPWLSPIPKAYSNSCPSSWWCHKPFHPQSSPSLPAFSLSQHQGLFQLVSSSSQVAKVLEFQLQHQSFQWIFRTDFF